VFIRHRPSAPLDAAIECIWLSRRSENSPDCEHMLPSGKADLVITLHDSPIQWASANDSGKWRSWTRGVIHGPQSSFYLAGPKPKGTVVGVSFRPGMAGGILGVPMSELLDSHVSLEELWGYRGLELQERLADAEDRAAIFRLLESELIARIRRPLLIHPAVAHALRPHRSGLAPWRVEDVQRQSGYSPRHFIELFRSTVGLAPKRYYRVQRFSNALARIAEGNVAGELKLADVAACAGYSDQAHLSREFRELAGVTASAYHPRAADSAHHHVVAR
jgi:AraC-like DNA-binding protein